MRFILVVLMLSLILLVSCTAPAYAVRVGGGLSHYPDPVPVSTVPPNMIVIHYYPLGYHLMTPLISPQWNSPGLMNLSGGAYYFGRDFDLGMIDNNYAGAPFVLQVLADP